MAKQPKSPRDNTRYVDRPEVNETFVDSIETFFYDGQVVRLTLSSIRWGEFKPPKPPAGKRVTAARLVLTPEATVEMANTLQSVMAVFEKQGLIKRPSEGPVTLQ